MTEKKPTEAQCWRRLQRRFGRVRLEVDTNNSTRTRWFCNTSFAGYFGRTRLAALRKAEKGIRTWLTYTPTSARQWALCR